MNDNGAFGIHELERRAQAADQPRHRAVGSPLPVGGGAQPLPSAADEEEQVPRNSPPGRALTNAIPQQGSSLDRAMSMLRSALPFAQRLLPLLDGNVVTAVTNLLTSRAAPSPAHPPLDLEPIQSNLAELRNQHRELRDQVGEQNTSLKRVEDQLEMVREATDRNTLEQQELMEDLKTVGNKVNVFAMFALGLLAVSILINIVLYLYIRRVLP